MKKQKTFMARDQWGQTIHNLGPHPRKALLNHFGRKHADRMFCDKNDGSVAHIGWIIAGHWFQVYEVIPMERPYR